jgi:fatty acid desaturase
MDTMPPQTLRSYADLRRTAAAAGLFERAYRYYIVRALGSVALVAAALGMACLLPDAAVWSALTAIVLTLGTLQIGFIGHDAGHLAVFRTWRANATVGQHCLSAVVGLGFSKWCDVHDRHHAHTNDLERDGNLQVDGVFAFSAEDAAASVGWRRFNISYQAFSFWFLLLFGLIAARASGWWFAVRQLRGRRRLIELSLLSLNAAVSALPLVPLGTRWVGIYLVSQLLQGLYLGLVVAPNHKGMPTWAANAKLSFLERQVMTSRNITPPPVWDFLYGGLNYQVEHHLFPSMPQAHLGRARTLVKPFCAAHGLPYEELSPLASYRAVFSELRRVSRAASRGPQRLSVREQAALHSPRGDLRARV